MANKKNKPIPPASNNDQTVQLQVPQANPYNLQATKRYIFNETGNIMLASTELGGDTIADSVRDVFAEVSVFFAAMTKAISTTINPNTGQPYSLYNYNAIQNVIDGSGLFVHVNEEDIEHTTTSFGATFSKELIEGLLGLATGAGALSFAQGMISSLGSAGLKIGGHVDSSDNKVANIVFICEYLLGMPIVSAMVVTCDAKENSQTFKIGPCFSESTTHTTLKMHKDTYMFVTPKFIRQYSDDLDSITKDQAYFEFVDYLQELVRGEPIITAVQVMNDPSGNPAPSELTVGTTYVILGSYLDDKGKPENVEVAWVAADGKSKGSVVANAEIQSNVVSFSPTANSTPAAIGIFFSDGKATPTWTLAVATPLIYTAKKDTPTPSLTISPTNASFSKATNNTVPVTVSIDNSAGLTFDTIKSISITDGQGSAVNSIKGTVSGKKINLKYTAPGTPKAVSGTVTFDVTTKKADGSAGDTISGSFDFDVS